VLLGFALSVLRAFTGLTNSAKMLMAMIGLQHTGLTLGLHKGQDCCKGYTLSIIIKAVPYVAWTPM
jgi:hypothetical protein